MGNVKLYAVSSLPCAIQENAIYKHETDLCQCDFLLDSDVDSRRYLVLARTLRCIRNVGRCSHGNLTRNEKHIRTNL